MPVIPRFNMPSRIMVVFLFIPIECSDRIGNLQIFWGQMCEHMKMCGQMI